MTHMKNMERYENFVGTKVTKCIVSKLLLIVYYVRMITSIMKKMLGNLKYRHIILEIRNNVL